MIVSDDIIAQVIRDHRARCTDPETCVDDAFQLDSNWLGCTGHIVDEVRDRVASGSQVRADGAVPKPKVVTLSGSRKRAGRAFIEHDSRLTLEGCIVLSIDDPTNIACADRPEAVKARLDELHFRKIDISHRLLVLNVGGYIGESTRNEIEYAKTIGVPVDYLEPPAAAGAPREQESHVTHNRSADCDTYGCDGKHFCAGAPR